MVSMTELLQIQLESSKVSALDAQAAHAGKRRDELVAQAVEDLLALEQHNIDAIREGLADLKAGRVVPREEVLPLIEALRQKR
jgi:predicted transcriptional regulator